MTRGLSHTSVWDRPLRVSACCLSETVVGEQELRFAGTRLAESLGDTLRIAESRGGRLESGGNAG